MCEKRSTNSSKLTFESLVSYFDRNKIFSQVKTKPGRRRKKEKKKKKIRAMAPEGGMVCGTVFSFVVTIGEVVAWSIFVVGGY